MSLNDPVGHRATRTRNQRRGVSGHERRNVSAPGQLATLMASNGGVARPTAMLPTSPRYRVCRWRGRFGSRRSAV